MGTMELKAAGKGHKWRTSSKGVKNIFILGIIYSKYRYLN
jgi:hypothetical protein